MQGSKLTMTLTTVTFLAFIMVGMIKASPDNQHLVEKTSTAELGQQH